MRTMHHFILIFLLTCSLPLNLRSQCQPTGTATLHGNKVAATLHNGGDMFWNLQNQRGYIVPWTSNVALQRHSLGASAFWMGGLDLNGALHVASQTYRQNGNDFFPGPVRSNGNYGCDSVVTFSDSPFLDGLMLHSSGKVLAFYNSGFGEFDPASWNVTDHIFPANRDQYNVLELPNQKVLVACQSTNGPEPIVLVTPPAFSSATGITLNLNHTDGSLALLSNGMVLIVSPAGAEIYDPVADTSGVIPGGTLTWHNPTCITLSNGLTWVTGGGITGTTGTELFDPVTRTWSLGPNLLQARTGHVLEKMPSGEVLIFGGSNLTTQVEIYNPLTNNITLHGNLPLQARTANSVQLANGNILLTVSNTISATQHGLIEYNPFNQQSVIDSSVFIGRRCVALPGGNVLVENNLGDFRIYDPVTRTWLNSRYQKIWKVTASQIAQFQSDFNNSSVNFASYPDIQTWPGNGNMSLTEDQYLAPFVDVNNDGWYKPAQDGDYPCITGDQMLWYVMNDVANLHSNTPGPAISVQAEVSAYAFDCNTTACPDTALDYTTFYHLGLINKSTISYTDFRLSFFLDAGIGNEYDDYVATDSLLEMAISYNGDSNDETAGGYGLNPPALGIMELGKPLQSRDNGAMFIDNNFSISGNPSTDQEYYNYMNHRWLNGAPLTYGTAGTVSTNWFMTGDPGWCGNSPSGWHNHNSGNQPFDQRIVLNSGSADFLPGDTLKYDFAIVWSRGNNGNLSSVCKLKADAQAVRNWWDTQNFSCFNLVMDKPGPKAEVKGFELYPNPATHSVTVSLGEKVLHNTPVRVLNSLGVPVAGGEISPGHSQQTIEIASLPAGIYFVEIFTSSGPVTKRLVIGN